MSRPNVYWSRVKVCAPLTSCLGKKDWSDMDGSQTSAIDFCLKKKKKKSVKETGKMDLMEIYWSITELDHSRADRFVIYKVNFKL